MKTLEKILFAVLVIAFLMVLIAFLLPAKWHVQQSIVIQAPAEKIHPYIEDLHRWQAWSPWNTQTDPTVHFVYTGAPSGVGAAVSWLGQKTGQGSLMITKSDPSKGISYLLQLGPDSLPSNGRIDFETVNGQTQVTWSDEGELGNNPLNRYVGLAMQSVIAADLKDGLLRLKKLVETH